MRSKTNETWRIKAEAAWRTAAQCAVLAQEADEKDEREYYIRMRDAWIGLANRCVFLDLPHDTKRLRASSNPMARPSPVGWPKETSKRGRLRTAPAAYSFLSSSSG